MPLLIFGTSLRNISYSTKTFKWIKQIFYRFSQIFFSLLALIVLKKISEHLFYLFNLCSITLYL